MAYDLPTALKRLPERRYLFLAAFGIIFYAAFGIASMALGANFLDYNVLGKSAVAGQHLGILIIEFGVGVTVFGVMLAVYYAFASRPPRLDDKDW